jgi:hypothetical protein
MGFSQILGTTLVTVNLNKCTTNTCTLKQTVDKNELVQLDIIHEKGSDATIYWDVVAHKYYSDSGALNLGSYEREKITEKGQVVGSSIYFDLFNVTPGSIKINIQKFRPNGTAFTSEGDKRTIIFNVK